MQKHIEPSLLEDNAEEVVNTSYTKHLSEDDLIEKRELLADKVIESKTMADEAKSIADSFKERLKPVKELVQKTATEIKLKAEERHGKIYRMFDYESKMVGEYDEQGDLILERRMKPSEMQTKIKTLHQKAV